MDQHPIPQDVTGFQFKLIGNMTVKQFGYVAAGVISSVLLYYMPLNFFLGILFKLFFVPIFGVSGIIVAFIPIEGRPVDVMAGNFLKAIVTPNQYIYIKKGRKLTFLDINTYGTTQASNTSNTLSEAKQKKTDQNTSTKERQLDALLHQSTRSSNSKLDEKEVAYLKLFNQPTSTTGAQVQHTPKIIPIKPLPAVSQNIPINTSLTDELQKLKQDETQTHTPQELATIHQRVLNLEKQLQDAHLKKSQLEEEVLKLQTQLNTQPPPPPAIPVPQGQPAKTIQNKANMPYIPDTPNVLVGIVKDPRGNMLPSMLVEVKDKNGNPVRAFKTNALGQFASATPLASGIYTIQLEDPKKQHMFEAVQISVTNQIMMPIEITSHDAREELRKQLFN